MPAELVFRLHAVQRMFERRITVEDVRKTLESGETIERYPNDAPHPSRLVLGWAGDRPIHVVVADNPASGDHIVVTVYEPDPAQWEPGFRQRKSP